MSRCNSTCSIVRTLSACVPQVLYTGTTTTRRQCNYDLVLHPSKHNKKQQHDRTAQELHVDVATGDSVNIGSRPVKLRRSARTVKAPDRLNLYTRSSDFCIFAVAVWGRSIVDTGFWFDPGNYRS